jgi:hypothetical protein
VKTEPGQPASSAAAAASAAAATAAMKAVIPSDYATGQGDRGGGSEDSGQQQQHQLALDEDYVEDSYDYGEYGEGGGGLYEDESGLMDPNTGLPIPAGSDGNKGRGSDVPT